MPVSLGADTVTCTSLSMQQIQSKLYDRSANRQPSIHRYFNEQAAAVIVRPSESKSVIEHLAPYKRTLVYVPADNLCLWVCPHYRNISGVRWQSACLPKVKQHCTVPVLYSPKFRFLGCRNSNGWPKNSYLLSELEASPIIYTYSTVDSYASIINRIDTYVVSSDGPSS